MASEPPGPGRRLVMLLLGGAGVRSTAATAQPAMTLLAATDPAAPIALEAGTVFVSLGRMAGAPTDRRVFLVLRALHADSPPGVLWQVYFDLPKAAPADPDDPHLVGTLNFFSASRPGAAPISRSFDVTALVHRLAGEPSVTLIPDGVPAKNSRPMIGRIELIAQ